MAEKRVHTRLKKRLRLNYGAENATQVAFTEDITEEGIFIRAVNVMPPGAKVLVVLTLPDNEAVCFEARVMWSRRVPSSLIHLTKKGGMGVKIISFLSNEQKYREFCSTATARSARPATPPKAN